MTKLSFVLISFDKRLLIEEIRTAKEKAPNKMRKAASFLRIGWPNMSSDSRW
ncbi:hypothetical protein [Bacillus sp. EB600]|uniref:hypothetical protein n=1 Tax=Bacillus sp. EB600 TaxID=2806345 RepID=UPI00210ADFD0|nr:hypothetical protein [Bacillus sp. EB600]MCQ6282644.1 hypothetical protein [Bacillus sp. EB600]